MTDLEWGECRDGLKKSVGPSNFRAWIEPLGRPEISDEIATFEVSKTFFGNYVAQNFSDQITFHLRGAGHPVQRVRFVTRTDAAPAPRPAAEPVAAPAPADAAEDKAFSPDARFTFDQFVVGKSNELAHAAARRVAEGGPVAFNPLFLHSGVGLGKTHLMHAIAHEIRARSPEKNVLYISAENFMYRFITALREKKMMELKQVFRSVDVLMVDDVQFLAGKESTQEEFFHTFNHLVESGKQIVLSADRNPVEIRDIDARIRSRLQCGLVVDLHPTDYELRMGILQSKAQYHAQTFPGVTISDEMIGFLAHRIVSNVRVLEGALTRLYAMSSLTGREISLDMAKDVLADLIVESDRKLSIDEIQRKVCDHYNIKLADMLGPRRVRALARPRQVAMYLCKTLTRRSFPEIGRRFGKRDHTTVMHAVSKIEELLSTDSQIAEDVELLRRALES